MKILEKNNVIHSLYMLQAQKNCFKMNVLHWFVCHGPPSLSSLLLLDSSSSHFSDILVFKFIYQLEIMYTSYEKN